MQLKPLSRFFILSSLAASALGTSTLALLSSSYATSI